MYHSKQNVHLTLVHLEGLDQCLPSGGCTLKGLLGDIAVGLRTTKINRYKPEGKINTTVFSLYLAFGTMNKTCEVCLLIDGQLCDVDFR